MSIGHETEPADAAGMTVRCHFFARYTEIMGCTEVMVLLPRGSTVAAAVDFVRSHVPGGQELPTELLIAKNRQHVKHDSVVEDGDELAFLPPLGGG